MLLLFCDTKFLFFSWIFFLFKDAARRLIIHALHKVADQHQITYEDLLRLPPGQRRRYHDDITVVVFFFDYEATVWAHRDNNWEQVNYSLCPVIHPNLKAECIVSLLSS